MKFSIALLLLTSPSLAFAHATLDHADPKVGSTVQKPPTQVKAWFSEGIEPAFSKLEVDDSAGKQIDQKDSHVDDHDKTELTVSLPSLPAGEYTVKWSVVSVDTHHTHGDFKFTVQPK